MRDRFDAPRRDASGPRDPAWHAVREPNEARVGLLLRPMTASDLDFFEADMTSPEGTGPYQWFGYTNVGAVRKRFEERGLVDSDGGILAIATEADGYVGRVEWFKSGWGRPDHSSCWTIAIGLRAPFRGRGLGSEAQRALVDYLFRHTAYARIQAFTDVENIAERRALIKAGFSEEGTLRAAQWRDGRRHDQVLYSAIRP